MSEGFTSVMAKIGQLAHALDIHDLNQWDGCWIHHLDDHWTFAVNGTRQDRYAQPEGMARMNVRPFEAVIWWNGWPAGHVWTDGGIMAHGSHANEDTLLIALQKAIDEAQPHEQ